MLLKRNTIENNGFKISLAIGNFDGIHLGHRFIINELKKLKKNNNTKRKHIIELISKKKIQVNSYHDYSITKLGKNLDKIAHSKDGSIEAFKHKNKKILGIMWHPERYSKIKKFDLLFIDKYL